MRVLAAALVAFSVAVLSGVGLAFLRGGLAPPIADAALACGALLGVVAWGANKGAAADASDFPKGWQLFPILCFVLFSLRAFCWLIFFNDDDIKVLSPNNLGDAAIHLTYIQYLANGAHFWPDEPIFAGHSLHYPIGVDLFNSLLVLCGMDVYRSLIWVGLLGCLASGYALYKWGGAFGLAGFLFNGGVAGFAILQTHGLADFQKDLAWKSLPLAVLVTQRSLLYALPAGLALLISWRARFWNASKGLPVWIEVWLYSTMPLFHVHTFIFLSLLLAFWFVTGRGTRRSIAALVAWSLAPASLLIGLVCGLSSGGSMIHVINPFKAGLWTQGDARFLDYWWSNFGLFPAAVLILVVMLIRKEKTAHLHSAAFAFVAPALLIFFFACVVILAPWDWDNIKIILWCYVALLPFLWEDVLCRWPVALRGVACVALFFSGFVSLAGGLDKTHTGYDLAKRSELDGAREAARALPVSAVFAGFPTYNHPILLAGRKMVLGYPGHLWSHGYAYQAEQKKMTALLRGDADWRQIAASLGARYLFWGDKEESGDDAPPPDAPKPWEQECPQVEQGEWGAIYDLTRSKPNLPAK